MGQRKGGVGKASGSALCLKFAGEREAALTSIPRPVGGGPDARVMTPLLLCPQRVICMVTIWMCGDPVP